MMEASRQALAFIRGTGLEVMIQKYGMDYNADSLREIFYGQFHIKEN